MKRIVYRRKLYWQKKLLTVDVYASPSANRKQGHVFQTNPLFLYFKQKLFVTHVSFRTTRVLPSDSHNSFAYLGPIKFLTLSWFFKSNSEFIYFTHKSYSDSIFHFFSRKSIDHLPVYFKLLRFMFARTFFIFLKKICKDLIWCASFLTIWKVLTLIWR